MKKISTLPKRKQPTFWGSKNKWGQESYKHAVMHIEGRGRVHFKMIELDI